ncbi:hypothetical protein P43SY_009339 [Pythium insidiosum]|uniref:Vacuolar protein 8 n=1 Tax=Pythium insidiosum TaxID=114742 RepID=A0AAD5M634_PYTIN|nr:hypothetical protein P43SY_009339 [Pythium insidiosum]
MTTTTSGTQSPVRRGPRKRGNTEVMGHALKPYGGDMFTTRGDYIDGMLYMSRMKRGPRAGGDWIESGLLGRNTLKDAVSDALSAAVAAAASGELLLNGGNSSSSAVGTGARGGSMIGTTGAAAASAAPISAARPEVSVEEMQHVQQRQRCALTLSNWSSNSQNARVMVEENAVEALIQLSKTDDRVTRLHCVTALMNLSHVDALRSEIVQQGAVKTVAEIANDTEDKTLRTACAITLYNLCCLVGEEEQLVEDGAVGALSSLINEHPKVAGICLTALFNLTCVREPYHKIESVLKVFLTLASSSGGGATRDEITAKAICNLSNFKRVRLRLMEEGIVTAIPNLVHPSQPLIQQLLAYILLNLSSMRACRSELVAKGSMGTLVALTSAAKDDETKQLVALTLWNLSKEPGNRLRMVFEGVLLLVSELCRGSSSGNSHANGDSAIAVCARTLYNVSSSEETRPKLVERDAVGVLSALSKRALEGDANKMCTLALCNLLSVQQAAADIVSAGAITSLIALSSAPHQTLETRHLFAKALYGLCDMASTRDAVIKAGIVPALLRLSTTAGDATGRQSVNATILARQAGLLSEIRARCTAALACLAGDDATSSAVCTADVVRCVTQILVLERFNVAIERLCCSCLSLLCRDEQCSRLMADEGAVEVVLATCVESQDAETKASCCHVLASMSCHHSCCMALVRLGAISVLATLTQLKGDAVIARCCAITLANLSADRDICAILVTADIIPLLSALSNSYSEESQRDCAKVLCNLSAVRDAEPALVRDGALGVLLMISMVRALQPQTKETCLRAFANLVRHDTVAAIVSEGLVKVLPALAGLDVPSANHVVSVLYAKLLAHPLALDAVCHERAALRALFSLMGVGRLRPTTEQGDHGGGDDDVEELHERLLLTLVRHDVARERGIHAGMMDALHALATRSSEGNERRAARIALAVFTLARHESTRLAVASPLGLSTLCAFLHEPLREITAESVVLSVSALCYLAWHDTSRVQLSSPDITLALTCLLPRMAPLGDSAGLRTALLALCCLASSETHLGAMLDDHLVDRLGDVVRALTAPVGADEQREPEPQPELVGLCCMLFRQLSHATAFAVLVAQPQPCAKILELFCLLASHVTCHREAALDCADALCNVAFPPLPTLVSVESDRSRRATQGAGLPVVRRQSYSHLSSRVAVSSSIPPAALVSADVLGAIAKLLAPEQLPETHWRAVATLFALSCIRDYRHSLVRLGCTQLLVREAYEQDLSRLSVATANSASLSIVRCCAGALCNLTIVPSAAVDANASLMVKHDAVPALIHLAKIEHDDVREFCTLALSNLSTQSPKLEAGAVSALLTLSMRSSGDRAAQPTLELVPGVARPPRVTDERFKQLSVLPDFEVPSEPLDTLVARKFEAERHSSKPPPPHLPTVPADLQLIGGMGGGRTMRPTAQAVPGSAAVVGGDRQRDEMLLRRHRSASIGDLLSLSPVTTPSTGSRGGSDPSDEGRGWPTMVFPKTDEVEGRALMLLNDDGDSDGEADASNAREPETARPTASESKTVPTVDAVSRRDVRLEHDDAVGNRAKQKSLSPLARVVVRKTQTTTATKKLKELRTRSEHHSKLAALSASATSLPLSTVLEDSSQELKSSDGARKIGPNKSASLSKLTMPQALSDMQAIAEATNAGEGSVAVPVASSLAPLRSVE